MIRLFNSFINYVLDEEETPEKKKRRTFQAKSNAMECAKCYLITTPFGLNSCHNANCLTSHSCDKRLFPGKFRLDLLQVYKNECLKMISLSIN